MRQGASRWPAVLAWGPWALVLLGIPVLVWLDHLLHRAGRPELTPLGTSDVAPYVLGMLSAELLAVVDQTIQPTRASLWLAPGARGREP